MCEFRWLSPAALLQCYMPRDAANQQQQLSSNDRRLIPAKSRYSSAAALSLSLCEKERYAVHRPRSAGLIEPGAERLIWVFWIFRLDYTCTIESKNFGVIFLGNVEIEFPWDNVLGCFFFLKKFIRRNTVPHNKVHLYTASNVSLNEKRVRTRICPYITAAAAAAAPRRRHFVQRCRFTNKSHSRCSGKKEEEPYRRRKTTESNLEAHRRCLQQQQQYSIIRSSIEE